MKKILVNVNYRDNSGKFWFDSYIKNQIVLLGENQSVHEKIKEMCENEGMTLTYKGKPQSNMFIDTETGESEIIGYVYRGKSLIDDRNYKGTMAYFDVWVEIHEISKFKFDEI